MELQLAHHRRSKGLHSSETLRMPPMTSPTRIKSFLAGPELPGCRPGLGICFGIGLRSKELMEPEVIQLHLRSGASC